MAVNGGLFSYAGNAAHDTELAKQDELKIAEGGLEVDGKLYNSPQDFIDGIEATPKYSASLLDANGVLTNNAKVTQENTETHEEQTAIIPKGFGIVTGCEVIEDGLVISDEFDNNGNSIGNEFVWIPVTVTGTTDAEKETSFDALRIDETGFYAEPASGDEQEYNLMRTSVITNGGFYITRYEAGYSMTEGRLSTDSSIVVTPLSKKGAYPYNMVSWSDAKSASQGMYNDSTTYGVKSTLCYGVQWDSMLRFLGKTSETNCRGWGNLSDAGPFDFVGEYYTESWKNDKTSKKAYTKMLLQTGAADRNSLKNIYDVAGNVWEWTMEYFSDPTSRVIRGVDFREQGYNPVRARWCGYMPGSVDTGFRVALYL